MESGFVGLIVEQESAGGRETFKGGHIKVVVAETEDIEDGGESIGFVAERCEECPSATKSILCALWRIVVIPAAAVVVVVVAVAAKRVFGGS